MAKRSLLSRCPSYFLEKLLVSQARNSSLSTESELLLSRVQNPGTLLCDEIYDYKIHCFKFVDILFCVEWHKTFLLSGYYNKMFSCL